MLVDEAFTLVLTSRWRDLDVEMKVSFDWPDFG